jgi:hypothetical protein
MRRHTAEIRQFLTPGIDSLMRYKLVLAVM